jgi:hypothetical protein
MSTGARALDKVGSNSAKLASERLVRLLIEYSLGFVELTRFILSTHCGVVFSKRSTKKKISSPSYHIGLSKRHSCPRGTSTASSPVCTVWVRF